jgi:CHAT domain-containing protein
MQAVPPQRPLTQPVHGVWWPVELERSDAAAVLRRVRELERRHRQDPAAHLELARLAASRGDFDTAVDQTSAEAAGASLQARSLAASSLLARALRSGSATDLLDAAEALSAISGEPAAACNQATLWERLRLSYRARELSAGCPAHRNARPAFLADTWNGSHVSSKELPPGERESVTRLLASGDGAAPARIRERAQAWRTFLEQQAPLLWAEAAADPLRRQAVERQLAALAAGYGAAAGNPTPARLISDLAAVAAADIPAVASAVQEWAAGNREQSEIRGEQAEAHFLAARRELGGHVPTLDLLVRAGLAAARYHLGDDRGLGEQAAALRRSITVTDHPALVARCLWLESLALQGNAEWELSARLARQGAALYDQLHEPANSGFLAVMAAFDLESMNLQGAAEAAYLSAVRRVADGGDTRGLASALEPFARQQSRAGRRLLAVEIQREVLAHRLADANPALVGTSRARLAEHLHHAGATDLAEQLLAEAEGDLAAIESERVRARLRATIDQVQAAVELERDPRRAVASLTTFLDTFEGFGERYQRAEALVQRARGRLQLGDLPGATADLQLGAAETADQVRGITDAVSATTLLNEVRASLELLVELLVRGDDATEALRWIESLRLQQQYRTLGLAAPPARWPELPPRTCATAYFALPRQLLAWTACGEQAPRLTTVDVDRDELARAVAAVRTELSGGDRAAAVASLDSLSGLLLQPIAAQLRDADLWLVVPDPALTAVPFAWLRAGERFLFEDHFVTVATSLSDLRLAEAGGAAPWRALAVGNPRPERGASYASLPHAEEEAGSVAARFGGRALLGPDATFAAVADELPDATLFHFAGHVYANQQLPAMSRMQFAPAEQAPSGRVSAQQIATMRLPELDLAVLAGCSSARDAARELGGSAELSHAFLVAGADTVVGTLWDVEDRALVPVFEAFYGALAGGSTPAEALRFTWLQAARGGSGIELAAAAALEPISNAIASNQRREP